MKKLLVLQTGLAALLFFLTAVQAARVVSVHFGWKISPGGRNIAALKPTTVEYLAQLRGRVSLTYFVSSRKDMPSSMQRVEGEVRALLSALKTEAPEQLDFRVIDPAADAGEESARVPPGDAYASRKSASPMKLRRVLQDASGEQAVWSSLAIAHEQHRDALIQGITPDELPYLEDLIIGHLKAGPRPLQPVVAVAAPKQGYSQLPDLISSLGGGARVIEVNLDQDPRIPAEADALFWIEPARATDAHRRELERFLRAGRSVLLAGSSFTVESVAGGTVDGGTMDGEASAYKIRHSSCDWETLLAPLGLRHRPRLILDEKYNEPITWRGVDGRDHQVTAPFQLRILPRQTDTRSLRGPSTGVLVVSAVSALEPDARRLREAGLHAETVSTTSEFTSVIDLPKGAFGDAAFANAAPVPKQPWLVLVESDDPWKGSALVAGSAVLFHDDVYRQKRNANRVFLRTLLRSLTEGSRLIRTRLPRVGPARLGAVSFPQRITWRTITVFLVPVVLLLVALGGGRVFAPRAVARRVVSRTAAGLALFLVVGLFLRGARTLWDPRIDLTAESINTPSALTMRLIEESREELSVELLASDELFMPRALKNVERRVVDTLRAFGLRYELTRPEDLSGDQQELLRSQGVEPFDVESIEDDTAVTNRVWCALRIRRGDQFEVVPRLDPHTVEHLEFLLAAAVRRIETGTSPLVGVLSDLPRLSPAEAHMDYQQKGYTAPVGSDVYSFSKSMLQQHGYRVAHINPGNPVFPESMDVLIWLQPRNPIKVLPQFGAYMAAGGKALVALQHYNVLQQQFRGIGFSTVYWPRPQFHRFNQYLELIGTRQVGNKRGSEPGEVLFDRNQGHLVLDTQVNRSAFREHNQQQVSRPFLIRAIADGLSSNSLITSRLGELLFIWPSRFTFDEQKLTARGLTREVLVSTSPATWGYAWSGGRIPEEAQVAPSTGLLGSQCLAAWVTGTFPRVETRAGERGRQTLAVVEGSAEPKSPDGTLCLIGSSEMFKNEHLYLQDRQHDEFLLNAVASLAYDKEMAEIAARRRTVPSFPAPPPNVTINLRLITLALSPLLFLLFGVLWRILRRPLIVSQR
jgi:ABC-type uncharacterized transport system involved in gliding motility auxiliary subunit